MFPSRIRVRVRPLEALRLPLLALLAVTAVLCPLAGCGGGSDADSGSGVVLATVDGREITASYYEDRLLKLEQHELPRDADGEPYDMTLTEGKAEFLETLIRKEIMSVTADRLGYPRETEFVNARETITKYEAAVSLRADAVDDPARTISDEEFNYFYERFGSSRKCRYVITNFESDAEAARAMAQGGADWDDVVREYHDGGAPPEGAYEITVPFGRYHADYERAVFDTPIGGVTPPIATDYGFWVLKIDGEKKGNVPPREQIEDRIVEISWNRKKAQLMIDFRQMVRDKYKFVIHDEALLKCYMALPQDEEIFYPGTKDPVKREDLVPLDVATTDMDLPLYGYERNGEVFAYTLGDYKTSFDRMNVFQRPKYGEMLGGLRQSITNEIDKALLDFEAEERGYYEKPEVVARVDAQMEEMIVSKLYQETVHFENAVDISEVEAYWAEHEAEFQLPEMRSGNLVICQDETTAKAAHAAAVAGMNWASILEQWNVDENNKARSGKLDNVRADASGPGKDVIFALEPGDVSEPFALVDGRYAVLTLDTITPPRQRTMVECSEEIGDIIRKRREEEAFQALLDKWRADMEIVKYEDRLDAVRSWKELKDEQAAELANPQV